MIDANLVEAFAFTAPIVCALACMMMMLMDARAREHDAGERNLRLFLAMTYLVTSLGWLGMVLYTVSTSAFARYYSVFLLTLMLDQVMIYRFVSVLTGTGERRKFNRAHLVIPFFVTALSVATDIAVPAEKQAAIISSGEAGGDFELLFKMLYTLATVVFIVYNTLYPVLNLRNIYRYRRFVVNYSSNAYNTSLGWLATIQALILVSVPFPFAGLLIGIPAFTSSYFVWLGALPYLVNYLVLCFNLLNDRYLIVQPEEPGTDAYSRIEAIDRERFERYLWDKKPFLDPDLRITSLAAAFGTNRSYVSNFINNEYGMNFCRLINRCRLQEFERLRSLPDHDGESNADLVLAAGFGSYRNYLRQLKIENGELKMSS